MQKFFAEIEDDARAVKREAASAERERAAERKRTLKALSKQARAEAGCTRRSWCSPDDHGRVVGVDIGCRQIVACVAGETAEDARRYTSLTELAGDIRDRDLVVCESAHIASPATGISLAQRFTEEELLAFYARCKSAGATLRLLPQEHTGTMRAWASRRFPDFVSEDKDTDANDALAFALYVQNCNAISLAKPLDRLSGKTTWRAFGDEVRLRANLLLNVTRALKGYEEIPSIADAVEMVADRLPDETRWFSRDNKKKGSPHIKFIASIAATIVGPKSDGDETPVIFTANGAAPGWHKFKTFVLRMTPFHRKAGVARSNLVYHRFRHGFADFATHYNGTNVKVGSTFKKHHEFTPEERMAKKAAWAAFRSEVAEVYRLVHEAAEALGYEKHDIV